MSERKATPDVLGEMLGAPVRIAPTVPAPGLPPSTPVQPPTVAPTKTRRLIPRRAKLGAAPVPVEWEYVTAILRRHQHSLRPYAIDDVLLENWQFQPELGQFLAVMGRYGWEMVGIVDLDRCEKQAFFKRAKG